MRPILAIALVAAFAIPAAADHCGTYTTSSPEVDAAGYYVDNDPCPMCTYSIFVYEESNGIPGLQRGDEVVDDTCHSSIHSDTIIL